MGDLKGAGLKTKSLVRLKLFTLDNRFIARRIGVLAARDRVAVAAELQGALNLTA